MKRINAVLLAALMLVAVGVGFVNRRAYERMEAQRDSVALAAANLEARHDTTRLLYEDSVARLVGRLAVQERDLAHAAHTILALSARGVQAAVDTVEVLKGDSSVRTATWRNLYRRPMTFDSVSVQLAPPGGDARLYLTWQLDTAFISLRVVCRPGQLVERAEVRVRTPPWLPTSITSAETDARVCQRDRRRPRWKEWLVVPAGAAAGALASYANRGSAIEGAAAGALIGLTVKFTLGR